MSTFAPLKTAFILFFLADAPDIEACPENHCEQKEYGNQEHNTIPQLLEHLFTSFGLEDNEVGAVTVTVSELQRGFNGKFFYMQATYEKQYTSIALTVN